MTRDELIETMARAGIMSDSTAGVILRAIEAAGYAVVPREPTVEMRVAGGQMMVNVYSGGVYGYGRVPANDGQPGDVGTIYRAMLAASPLAEK